MEHVITYKKYLIRGESFQPSESTGWIPRYVLHRDGPAADPARSLVSHDRLDKAFASQIEADDFAVQDAKTWIDNG